MRLPEIATEMVRIPFLMHVYRLVTNLLFFIGSPIWIAGLLVRPERWGNRIGYIPVLPTKSTNSRTRVWVHASSVGEVKATGRLVREMAGAYGAEVVFSTMTAAGLSVAKTDLQEPICFFYVPIDVPWAVRRALHRVKADVLLLVETELWPSLILEAKARGMKVGVVNGKVSTRGFERYRRLKRLFASTLGLLDIVVAQSEAHASRYSKLGAIPQRIVVGGNTKQDSQAPSFGKIGLREKTGWSPSDIILLAGSTRSNEEEIICEGLIRTRASLDSLRLVLAPRHLRRTVGVARIASSFNLRVARWSELQAGTRRRRELGAGTPAQSGDQHERQSETECLPKEPRQIDALILDTMGELAAAYKEADVAFIGGTLSGHGGHNVLEPAAAGLPIIAGTSVYNIEDDVSALGQRGALLSVNDAADVSAALISLASSPEERSRRGKEALAFYDSRPVASLVTLEFLRKAGIL